MFRCVKFLLVCSTIWLAACTSHPLMNVHDRPVPARLDGKPQSTEAVARAIQAGCIDKGWTCQEVSPGVIDASITVRKHRANATINYSAQRYSITYKNSYMLEYNEKRNTIHRNYNRWVNNLDHAITKNLVI